MRTHIHFFSFFLIDLEDPVRERLASARLENFAEKLTLVDRRRRLSARATASTSLHTSAYVSIRQHTSAYVSIRCLARAPRSPLPCIRQHTSAYVSIREHTSAYVSGMASIRVLTYAVPLTYACVSIRQRHGIREHT